MDNSDLGTLMSMRSHASSWQPPELQLLGALCKPDALPDAMSANASAADFYYRKVTRWPYFLELAEHHRVRPLVLKGVGRLTVPLPEDVQRVLREESTMNAREAFRYLAELQRLLALLRSSGIPATVLKGVPLSAMVYGDVGLREVGDIDLLIDPADAESADEVLRQSGLIRKEPAARLTPRRRDFYEKYFKDYTYEVTGGTSGFEVDLHWRLVRDAHAAHSLLADGSNALSNFEILKIGSMEMTVLTRERSLIYMAVHGATEGWARWKSLADIAALWVSVTQEQRLAVWGAAKTAGHTGFLRSALALATDWMGSFAEDSDADELSKTDDALEDYICTYARRRMIESHSLPSPGGQTTYAMKQHEARLYPAPSSRAALMMRVLFRPRLWEVVNLPDRLFFLYPVLSPVEWLYFRSRRWIHQKLRKDVPA